MDSGTGCGQLGLVHACSERSVERVVEHGLDSQWRRRIVAAFEFPGLLEQGVMQDAQ